MIDVSVVFPYTSGCPHREAAYRFISDLYYEVHPSWEQVIGVSPSGPYNRSAAIVDGALKARGKRLVVTDADVWCDPQRAIEEGLADTGWAMPHRLVWRLSKKSTEEVLAGDPWVGKELSGDNEQDRKPYSGKECGTLLVIERELLLDVPPDTRFVGWGHEDTAWALALHMLTGPCWRRGADLVHLWHPPQPRLSRLVGSDDSIALLRRYQHARSAEEMRNLISEVHSDDV